MGTSNSAMSLSSAVSILSVLYFISILAIAVLTSVYPFLLHNEQVLPISHSFNINTTASLDIEWSIMLGLRMNQGISFILGGFGNLLTLVAIPYMRQKYGSQFSILQLNSVVLILHLSLADLLFAIPSIPHRSGFFLLQEVWIDEKICIYTGLFRFFGGYVDFNTIAMISCCVARHNVCNTCTGVSLAHDTHDKLFGGKRVYLVCGYIWVVSILTILPDVMGVPGSYTLSGSPDVCDFGCPRDGCLKIFPVVGIIINMVFMIIFYIIIISNLYHKKKQVHQKISLLC